MITNEVINDYNNIAMDLLLALIIKIDEKWMKNIFCLKNVLEIFIKYK